MSDENYQILKKFSENFCPGPITMIVPCSDELPKIVTSNTGFVGIRIPDNRFTLELIKKCNLPLAAPSANTFGHISPTRKEHVLKEFQNNPFHISVLDVDDCKPSIGIESTIIKFDFDNKKIKILRPGFITAKKISNFMKNNMINFSILEDTKYKTIQDTFESSGEMITHYATNCETILIETSRKLKLEDLPFKSNIAIIDFNDYCDKIRSNVNYYDKLCINDIKEASFNYYDKLREFKNFNCDNIIKILYLIKDLNLNDELYNSLIDRMTRSSSGNIISIS